MRPEPNLTAGRRQHPEIVAVLGTGMMGGSFGLAARKRGIAERVVGFDVRPEPLKEALARGAVTEAAASAGAAVREASLVVIATPVGTIPRVFAEIVPSLAEDAIVTDVGSTKARIVEEIEPMVPPHAHFIGGHPIAGSEKDGIEAADPDLFSGCSWILTPTVETGTPAYRRLVRLLGRLEARVLLLDPARHDELVALTSHLPQLLASTLMGFAAEIAASEGGLPLVTAGGFRDMTRIAASSPDLWVDIVRENRSALLDLLSRFGAALEAARGYLENGDWEGLRGTLAAARDARAALPGKPGLVPTALVELLIPVPDRPGVLSEVTTSVGEAGVNIEDIDIVHSPEGGRGTIHLLVNGATAAATAAGALRRKGFSVDELPWT